MSLTHHYVLLRFKTPSTKFFTTIFPQVIMLSAGTSFTLPVTFKPQEKVCQIWLNLDLWFYMHTYIIVWWNSVLKIKVFLLLKLQFFFRCICVELFLFLPKIKGGLWLNIFPVNMCLCLHLVQEEFIITTTFNCLSELCDIIRVVLHQFIFCQG